MQNYRPVPLVVRFLKGYFVTRSMNLSGKLINVSINFYL